MPITSLFEDRRPDPAPARPDPARGRRPRPAAGRHPRRGRPSSGWRSRISPLLVGLDTDTPQVLTPTDSADGGHPGRPGPWSAARCCCRCSWAPSRRSPTRRVVSRDYHAAGSTLGEVLGIALRRALAAVAAAILAALAVLSVVAVDDGCSRWRPWSLLPTAAGEPGGLGVFLALVVGRRWGRARAHPARPAVRSPPSPSRSRASGR